MLTAGQTFAERYEIKRLLGAGGMGAVYEAWDSVLDVAVAVKVIRPDDTRDPAGQEALKQRFKRELLLARQVTHPNVVRIHDLGEVDGVMYITMPFVLGADLATLLKRDPRWPTARALGIARQVAEGLAAAHAAGVIHRDLKPANIMVAPDDRAFIMDFGIARSVSDATGPAVTQRDGVIGTVDYMAPEQASGAEVDERADIYSFGLILYDMLGGSRRSGASGVADLLQRMQHAPPPLESLQAGIPAHISATVLKCLQPDPSARYGQVADLLADLDGTQAAPSARASSPEIMRRPARRRMAALLATAAIVLAIAVGAVLWRDPNRNTDDDNRTPAGPTTSVAVVPFRNASGDAGLNALGAVLSQVLTTELGQTAFVRVVPVNRVAQVLNDLRIDTTTTLAPGDVARIADLASAGQIVWGQYARLGSAIRIDATLQDFRGGTGVPLSVEAAGESGLVAAISQLAHTVQQQLAGGSARVLDDLRATAWKPSTQSFDALRSYSEGVKLTQEGRHQEALKQFDTATKADRQFALAFAALAASTRTLGREADAVELSRQAVSLADPLPPQEKHVVLANHYRLTNEIDKATDAYEKLARAAPGNAGARFDLGGMYEQTGKLDAARVEYATVVELDPKYVEGLLALGRIDIKRGHPDASLEHLTRALTLTIQLDNDEARSNVLQAIGIAYKLLNRPDEALRHYEQSLEIKRRLGNKRGMASSYGEIAQIQERQGKPRDAERSLRAALALQREMGDRSGLASTELNLAALLTENLGRPDEALPLLREALLVRRESGNAPAEALVLNAIANVHLARGEFSEAQTNLERALEIRERANIPGPLADTVHNLGETLLRTGRYDQALSRFHRALELRRVDRDNRGVAVESYGIGLVFDAQGRFGAAVNSKAEALATYRATAIHDMWLAEILSGYAHSLNLAGRMPDAAPLLEEALRLTREFDHPNLTTRALLFQSERLYFSGDVGGAIAISDQASVDASRSTDPGLRLLVDLHASVVAAQLKPSRAIAARMAAVAQDATRQTLRELALTAEIERASTLLKVGGDRGPQEADRIVAAAETLGSRELLARAHFIRGEVRRRSGSAAAQPEYETALRLLRETAAESGGENFLRRADIAALYRECERWAKQ